MPPKPQSLRRLADDSEGEWLARTVAKAQFAYRIGLINPSPPKPQSPLTSDSEGDEAPSESSESPTSGEMTLRKKQPAENYYIFENKNMIAYSTRL